jgi:hypothetical protein
VLRGRPRVPPGEARPAAAPIALRARRGIVDLALGVAALANADEALDAILAALGIAPTVLEALSAAQGGRNVAIFSDRDTARATVSS